MTVALYLFIMVSKPDQLCSDVGQMTKDRFFCRNKFEKWILENTPYEYVAYTLPKVGLIDDHALADIISGKGVWANDAGGILFPDELACEYGGEEAQYGYIEFQVEALDGINRVPFEDAYDIFKAGMEIFLEERPDRRPVVEAKMREAQKTCKRLIARHKAWKRTNGVA